MAERRNIIGPGAFASGIGALVVMLGIAYFASPLVTLWRLRVALRHGDAASLAALVDWESVRRGLKQDIADGRIGVLEPQRVESKDLPPFGAGFAVGIAGGIVDQEVTPQHIAATFATPAGDDALPCRVAYAAFDDLDHFSLRLRLIDEEGEQATLVIRLQRHGLLWRVKRVAIPQDVMDLVASRT